MTNSTYKKQKIEWENPFHHPIDDIEAMVFGIAEEVNIKCELFNIAPHPFKPCRKYKWYFSDPERYYQVEIKNEELWIGYSGEYNQGFEMANPQLISKIKEWIIFLQGSERSRITSDRDITYNVL